MKKIILNTLLAVLVFGASSTAFAISDESISNSSTGTVCSQELKQCPDGSSVSRTGPRCEFARCPNANAVQKMKAVFEAKKDTREEVKNKIENRMASSTEKREERKEEVKNRIETKIASTSAFRLEKRFEKITKNYLKELVRLEQILSRTVTRIEKIKTLGGNTTEAEKYLEEARTELSEARKTYDVLKTIAANADSNATTTKEMLTNIKDSGKTVENHLRLAHKALLKTVGSLKGVSQMKNASSTAPTSN